MLKGANTMNQRGNVSSGAYVHSGAWLYDDAENGPWAWVLDCFYDTVIVEAHPLHQYTQGRSTDAPVTCLRCLGCTRLQRVA